MREVTIKVFQFDELPKKAQEKVLEKFRHINTGHEWYEPVYEGFEEIASEYGIEVEDMSFSGFYSQGDGASFTGEISDFKKFAEKTGLKRLVRLSDSIEYNLNMLVKRVTYQYCHNKTVTASVYSGGYFPHVENLIEEKLEKVKDELCEKLYRILEEEYCYLTSDEVVADTIRANGYEFTEGGELF